MVRPPCCDKPNVKKSPWSIEEDANALENAVSKHGKGNWNSVPRRPGFRRCGKSCRLRWSNHPRPDLKAESFTPKEEELIIKLHAAIGSRWSLIAQQLPGRTDNEVKNYWNTRLRKKLSDMGIDPVTHKPFSQILADYGNIGGGGFPNTPMRIGSLNKDLKNAILMKTEALFSSPPPPPPPPKTEPNRSSLDLLAQLQVIKLASDQASNPTAFSFSSSPSSASSSTSSSAAQETMSPPLAFNWNDFLLEDAFLQPSEAQDQGEKAAEFSPRKVVFEGPKEYVDQGNQTSSCENSYVEALLARENEMLLEFPLLLEEPFY